MRDKLFKILLALILLFAAFVRIRAYFFNVPFWDDEITLVNNVLNRGYFGFLKPLDYTQCAPFGFLVLTKIMVTIFGPKEFVFRFFPFLASILSVPVFYILSKKVLDKKWSILVANYLFAVNTWLAYHAKEFKQYSIEVLLSMVAILYLSNLDLKTLSVKKCIMIGTLFFAMFLFSMPACFVLAAFFIYLIYKNKKDSIKQIFFIALPFVLFALPYYLIYLLPSKMMMTAVWYKLWSAGYIKFAPEFLYRFFSAFFNYSFGVNSNPLAALVLTSFGTLFIFRDKKRINAIILFLFSAAILASILKIYPILYRLHLYLTPFVLLIAVKVLGKVSFCNLKKGITSVLVTLLFIWCFRANCIEQIKRLLGSEMYYSIVKCENAHR